jgi:hypothetical protein
MFLKIDETLDPISLGESSDQTIAVLECPPHKISGHTNVEVPPGPLARM